MPGIDESSWRGCWLDFLPVHQMAGIVIGDGARNFAQVVLPIEGRQKFADIFDFGAKSFGLFGIGWIVAQQVVSIL